mmetsp:Transcript_29480/g.46382  ORF Transcript_29480/g.46382 Transcript_29480/m.46382 type:complete len:241 (+) Transcript_29480:99-821(+)
MGQVISACCNSTSTEAPAVMGVLYAAWGKADVTEAVRTSFHGGEAAIKAENSILGADPVPFAKKILVVLFLLDNQDVLVRSTEEGTEMSFTADGRIPLRRHALKYLPGFISGILYAQYGLQQDVSSIVRKQHQKGEPSEDTQIGERKKLFKLKPGMDGQDTFIFIVEKDTAPPTTGPPAVASASGKGQSKARVRHLFARNGERLAVPADVPRVKDDELMETVNVYPMGDYEKLWLAGEGA